MSDIWTLTFIDARTHYGGTSSFLFILDSTLSPWYCSVYCFVYFELYFPHNHIKTINLINCLVFRSSCYEPCFPLIWQDRLDFSFILEIQPRLASPRLVFNWNEIKRWCFWGRVFLMVCCAAMGCRKELQQVKKTWFIVYFVKNMTG